MMFNMFTLLCLWCDFLSKVCTIKAFSVCRAHSMKSMSSGTSLNKVLSCDVHSALSFLSSFSEVSQWFPSCGPWTRGSSCGPAVRSMCKWRTFSKLACYEDNVSTRGPILLHVMLKYFCEKNVWLIIVEVVVTCFLGHSVVVVVVEVHVYANLFNVWKVVFWTVLCCIAV